MYRQHPVLMVEGVIDGPDDRPAGIHQQARVKGGSVLLGGIRTRPVERRNKILVSGQRRYLASDGLVALEAGFGWIVLHLQIERLSDRAEEVFEQYGVMAPPDVKSLQLRPGGLTNQETPEARVVGQHQAAVDGSANVGFHHVGE